MKAGGTKAPIPRTSNSVKFQAGDTLECTSSQSCAYTKGNRYEVYLNEHGWKCLRGDDGLEDVISMMCSTFKKVHQTGTP